MIVFSSGLFRNNPASFAQMLASFSVKPLTYLELNLHCGYLGKQNVTVLFLKTPVAFLQCSVSGSAVVNLEATTQINI